MDRRRRDAAHVHLAAFVPGAPTEQRDELWRVVGETLRETVGDAPLWLNTAGMGVAWLHVRLDTRPKYSRFDPYRMVPVS